MPDERSLGALLARAGIGREASAGAASSSVTCVRFSITSEAAAAPAPARPAPGPDLPPGAAPSGDDEARRALGPELAHATLEKRLERVLEWLFAATPARAAFVADHEGLPLANRHAPENYPVATALLHHADRMLGAYVPNPLEGCAAVELEGEGFLQIIWVDSAAGRLGVGVVAAAPLDRPACAHVRRLIRVAVETKGKVP